MQLGPRLSGHYREGGHSSGVAIKSGSTVYRLDTVLEVSMKRITVEPPITDPPRRGRPLYS